MNSSNNTNQPANELANLRKEYTQGGLLETDLDSNPIVQFQTWFQQAMSAGLDEPNAMTLATVNATGQPSARVVLLKAVDDRGFSFFTNYESRKAQDLAGNAKAGLGFFWMPLERQVLIEGTVAKLSRADSETYFKLRPHGSQLGAWVSRQSSVVASRAELEKRLRELEAQYPTDVPTPPYWGGYVLTPRRIEFWQGRPNRLHDRLCYLKQVDGSWKIERLSP